MISLDMYKVYGDTIGHRGIPCYANVTIVHSGTMAAINIYKMNMGENQHRSDRKASIGIIKWFLLRPFG